MSFNYSRPTRLGFFCVIARLLFVGFELKKNAQFYEIHRAKGEALQITNGI
jgi:hypothetical protein